MNRLAVRPGTAVAGGSPWHWADTVKAAGLIAVGAVLWAVGWYEVSDRAAMDDQIAPLNLAVVGGLLIGAGQASWFLTGRRAVGRRRRSLLGAAAGPLPTATIAPVDVFSGGERLYHRLDCAMVSDRAWTPSPRAAHEAHGRTPCGLCRP